MPGTAVQGRCASSIPRRWEPVVSALRMGGTSHSRAHVPMANAAIFSSLGLRARRFPDSRFNRGGAFEFSNRGPIPVLATCQGGRGGYPVWAAALIGQVGYCDSRLQNQRSILGL
jgi:hypothetical protein